MSFGLLTASAVSESQGNFKCIVKHTGTSGNLTRHAFHRLLSALSSVNSGVPRRITVCMSRHSHTNPLLRCQLLADVRPRITSLMLRLSRVYSMVLKSLLSKNKHKEVELSML